MNSIDQHQFSPDASFDGGDLDCGGGLLFLIRKHLDPLRSGELLEILSTDTATEEELPAWCRLTKNDLISWTKHGSKRSFLICKGKFNPDAINSKQIRSLLPTHDKNTGPKPASTMPEKLVAEPDSVKSATELQPRLRERAQQILPLSVMGIGSWPRPDWLLAVLHERLEGRLSEETFQHIAEEAIHLAVDAQLKAGVDVVTDGELRRDNYASFVGRLLENCQLVPLTDLLPLVEDPDKFEREMQRLDVPTEKVRHPIVLGPIKRVRPLVLQEYQFVKGLTNKPIKVALPGPYLLTRTMWMDCLPNQIYATREELSEDLVHVLREEIEDLLAAGVALIQLDEPVLSEVVFSGSKNTRSFMCGALSEREDLAGELEFAKQLINRTVRGMERSRLAMHICRGNWTADESVALHGNYHPLLPLLQQLAIGTIFLEFCTPRAGDLSIIKDLPASLRIGIGVVNPKDPKIETLDQVLAKAQAAIDLVGKERILLTPDCGFATFADSPVASSAVAQAKLSVIAKAAALLRSN